MIYAFSTAGTAQLDALLATGPLLAFDIDGTLAPIVDHPDKARLPDDVQHGLAKIAQRLERAEADGICRYGLHKQDSALMTCIVATPLQRDHIHFVDGAMGGYAMAARALKPSA